MAFAVPPSKKSQKQNQFEFTIGERDFTVPLLRYIKPAIAFRLGDGGSAAAQVLFDEYLPEAFDLFEDSEQLDAFMQAWQEASGIESGESQASPAS